MREIPRGRVRLSRPRLPEPSDALPKCWSYCSSQGDLAGRVARASDASLFPNGRPRKHVSSPRALLRGIFHKLQCHDLDVTRGRVVADVEAKVAAHPQHRGVFGEHLAVYAPKADRLGVVDHA